MEPGWSVTRACIRLERGGVADRTPDPNGEPTKPNLNIVKVNMEGTMYTWKLAVHYFRKQPDTEDRDRCFIITGSMVAFIDSPVRRPTHMLHTTSRLT